VVLRVRGSTGSSGKLTLQRDCGVSWRYQRLHSLTGCECNGVFRQLAKFRRGVTLRGIASGSPSICSLSAESRSCQCDEDISTSISVVSGQPLVSATPLAPRSASATATFL